MANNYRQRSGDRYDGRLIHTLPAYKKLIPFVMKSRSDAQCSYEQSYELTDAEAWISEQREKGYPGMGMLHLFVAAYVRTLAALPALNRFVSGRQIYARDSIELVLPASRGTGANSAETEIKVELEPTDTVFDVYNKLDRAYDRLRASDERTKAEELAERMQKLPRFLVRFFVWLVKLADFLGLLPKKFLDASPFHGSVRVNDISAFGIGPIRRGISDFGNLPMSVTLGAKRTVFDRPVVDASFVFDSRIADDKYFANAFRFMDKLIMSPELLEIPPELVKEDIF